MIFRHEPPIEPISNYVYNSHTMPQDSGEADPSEKPVRRSVAPFRSKLFAFFTVGLFLFILLFTRVFVTEDSWAIGLSAYICPIEKGDIIICTRYDEPFIAKIVHTDSEGLWILDPAYQSSLLFRFRYLIEPNETFKVIWAFRFYKT